MKANNIVSIALLVVALLAEPVVARSATTEFKLEEATIQQIQQALLGKRFTTEQLVRAYLARLKA